MEMTHEKGAEEILSVVNYCKRDISFEITNADGFCSIDLTMRYNDEDGENQLTEFEYDTEKTKGVPTGRGFCHEREDIGSAIADEFKKKWQATQTSVCAMITKEDRQNLDIKDKPIIQKESWQLIKKTNPE